MMLASAERIAVVLANRLELLLPLGIGVRPVGATIRVQSQSGSEECVDIGRTLAIAPERPQHVAATILGAVSQVQDFVAVELHRPWPGTNRLPLPRALENDVGILLGFVDVREGTIELPPITWQEISGPVHE